MNDKNLKAMAELTSGLQKRRNKAWGAYMRATCHTQESEMQARQAWGVFRGIVQEEKKQFMARFEKPKSVRAEMKNRKAIEFEGWTYKGFAENKSVGFIKGSLSLPLVVNYKALGGIPEWMRCGRVKVRVRMEEIE